jgi:hypothetical protein
MALLTILEFPDPRLRTRAVPVSQVDESLRQLIDDMTETMYAANGVGLAATQVNVHKRVVVIDISEERNDPRVFINPEIITREGVEVTEEGTVRPAPTKKCSAPNVSPCAPHRTGHQFTLARMVCWRMHPAKLDHWKASCLSTICPTLNAPAFARSWKKSTRNVSAKLLRRKTRIPYRHCEPAHAHGHASKT